MTSQPPSTEELIKGWRHVITYDEGIACYSDLRSELSRACDLIERLAYELDERNEIARSLEDQLRAMTARAEKAEANIRALELEKRVKNLQPALDHWVQRAEAAEAKLAKLEVGFKHKWSDWKKNWSFKD